VHNDRILVRLARATLKHQEAALADEVASVVDEATRATWRNALLGRSPQPDMTVLEWLQESPSGRTTGELTEQLSKRAHLEALGADRLILPTVSAARLDAYARRIAERRPASLPARPSPRATVTLACFLRQQWLLVADTCLDLVDRLITDARRRASERALAAEPARYRDLRKVVASIWEIVSNDALDPAEAVARVRSVLEPVVRATVESRAALARRELAHGREVRPLLETLATFTIGAAASHPLATALPLWRRLQARKATQLPADAAAPFARCWRPLIAHDDRREALLGYEAAVLITAQRGLRNGTVHVVDSRKYKALEALLIPAAEWSARHGRSFRRLGLSQSATAHLKGIRAALNAALERLATAVRRGEVTIRDGRVLIGSRKRFPKPPNIVQIRRKMYQSFADVQLPEVVLEVDSETRFSWQLLGRPPHGDAELITLYGALLAHGSDLTAAEIVRMVPGLTADQVSDRMRRLEQEEPLRRANEVVLNFLRSHPISHVWGKGFSASADMMSLDATRYLWMARMDPRRRTPAVGTYTHVLDQGGIVYDQPIVLNKRQAGAAIEGALRQRLSSLRRVAVDTHGFTHVAMCLAKLIGLDLCPRLADLADRKLYLPKNFVAPAALCEIASPTVSLRVIERGWDAGVRIAASIDGGWCSPTQAIEKLGSGAAGLPVYEAINALGKLYRTMYLCDYWTNDEFRQQILDLLNQGESVHSLQRALHNGLITAKRGRASSELVAISGSLALLANIVMAYNTSRMDALYHTHPAQYDPRAMQHVAPIGHAHINLRGTFTFNIERFRDQLFRSPRQRRAA